ncbi:MAG: response regulator transcription factor [Promicromonosporaceae bacterium]|nr:response regulator transcription factor [Promicromonosporaceae bacterium]
MRNNGPVPFTVLVCDDDADIRAALEVYLTQSGYQVIGAADGVEALEVLARETVHLVVLDVMMPRMDGIQTAVAIRATSNVPILFLSAKGEDTDRVLGLNMGGDDYLVKPFNPVELLARIAAMLRRYARLGGLGGIVPDVAAPAASPGVLQTGGLVLDDAAKRVTVDGREVSLTAIEFGILQFLMESPEQVFSSEQIYENVWAEPPFNVSKTVAVHIRHIRQKIEVNPSAPDYLKVVHGFGYKIAKLQ